MKKYSEIKELVIDACASEGQLPRYEELLPLVQEHFPESNWQKNDHSIYESRIKSGELSIPGIDSDGGISVDSDEVRLSLERDLESYLARAVTDIEDGLVLEPDGIEYKVDAGRIDLLAKDSTGKLVVIELKTGVAEDAALGQLLGYVGCLSEKETSNTIRGILVAYDFNKRLVYAVKALPHIKLVKYCVKFEEIT